MQMSRAIGWSNEKYSCHPLCPTGHFLPELFTYVTLVVQTKLLFLHILLLIGCIRSHEAGPDAGTESHSHHCVHSIL